MNLKEAIGVLEDYRRGNFIGTQVWTVKEFETNNNQNDEKTN